MLHQKPIGNITWDDVSSFCDEQIAENTVLDYKEDFPNDLPKVISAFANTYGGIILIGVAENNHNKPVIPISGINFEDNLSERITSIALSNITPPVIPEICICPNEAGDKVVIVIRVHQSHETPHAIAKNTRVYTRVNDISNPIKQADLDQVEWLKSKREKSVSLRERLISRADQRFWRNHAKNPLYDSGSDPYGILTVSLCPLFPKEELESPPALNIQCQDFCIQNKYTGYPPFPHPNVVRGSLAQEGIIIHESGQAPEVYTELSGFGLYFYRKTVSIQPTERNNNTMFSRDIMFYIAQFLDSSILFCRGLNIHGPLYFNVCLTIGNNCKMHFGNQYLPNVYDSHDQEVNITETIPLADQLQSDFFNIVHKMVKRIWWAFGQDTTIGELTNIVQQVRRT